MLGAGEVETPSGEPDKLHFSITFFFRPPFGTEQQQPRARRGAFLFKGDDEFIMAMKHLSAVRT